MTCHFLKYHYKHFPMKRKTAKKKKKKYHQHHHHHRTFPCIAFEQFSRNSNVGYKCDSNISFVVYTTQYEEHVLDHFDVSICRNDGDDLLKSQEPYLKSKYVRRCENHIAIKTFSPLIILFFHFLKESLWFSFLVQIRFT